MTNLLSATVTPRDFWQVHVESRIAANELVHHYTAESNGEGVRIHLRGGLFLDIDNDKIEVWLSTVEHGDYVDKHLDTIDLTRYRR